MKEKIKNILQKSSSVLTSKEVKQLSESEELKLLRKENEQLKKDLTSQAIEKFKNRRSIRKFSEQKIDFKILHSIIEAGLNAPCAGNVQNYKIIVIEDLKQKTECGKIAFQQYWLADAPCLLVLVRDNLELQSLYPDRGEIYAIQNVAAVIENILMAAHFNNLGACWVEAFDNEILKEDLGIPMELKIDAIVPIGYALERPQVDKVPMINMVYFEKYGNKVKN